MNTYIKKKSKVIAINLSVEEARDFKLNIKYYLDEKGGKSFSFVMPMSLFCDELKKHIKVARVKNLKKNYPLPMAEGNLGN